MAFCYYNRWELFDERWSPSQHTGRRMWEGAGGCHPGCGTALPTPSVSSSTMAKTAEQAKRLRRSHSLWTLQLSDQPFVSDLIEELITLHAIVISFFLPVMIVFLVWFTANNIASTRSKTDILDGLTVVAVVTLYAALGVYSHVSTMKPCQQGFFVLLYLLT